MSPRLPMLLPVLALLGACATQDEPGVDPVLPPSVELAWGAVQPEGLLDLVADPTRALPQGIDCPTVDFIDGVETWTGGCALEDGTQIEGRLSRHVSDDGSWVAGEQLAVYQDGRLALYLDGAVEVAVDGDLLLLDAAATTCGAHVDCEDGLVALDLRFTVLPEDDDLHAYDATVRGFVAPEDAEPAAVEGAWRFDAATCELEPLDGIFAVLLEQRHTLVLDGDAACDACADRLVQGVATDAWCADAEG